MQILSILLASIMIFGAYPTTARVTKIDYDSDKVTVMTHTGIIYQHHGCEDYEEGDIVSLLMYDNATGSVVDDIILKMQYSGF